MEIAPKKTKLPLKNESCPQLNGTAVQKIEVTPKNVNCPQKN
jgi:hypothetical protein